MNNSRVKSAAMLLMLMFLFAGVINCASQFGTSPLDLLHKGGKARKLVGLEIVVSDYDYAGANGKHDPRGRKGGGRNP